MIAYRLERLSARVLIRLTRAAAERASRPASDGGGHTDPGIDGAARGAEPRAGGALRDVAGGASALLGGTPAERGGAAYADCAARRSASRFRSSTEAFRVDLCARRATGPGSGMPTSRPNL